MSDNLKTSLVGQTPDADKPAKAAEAGGITVVNDAGRDAQILVTNNWSGFMSGGTVKAGQRMTFPANWEWWDVYATYNDYPPGVVQWERGVVGFNVYYSRKKVHVGYRDTVKISEMND